MRSLKVIKYDSEELKNIIGKNELNSDLKLEEK